MLYRKAIMLVFVLHIIVFSCLYQTRIVFAETSPASSEEIRDLLGKGLTIYEIDQELLRLQSQETQLSVQIVEVSDQAAEQEILVAAKRVHAGKVLRSYYTGQRQHLWMLILKADNFYDALEAYYYISLIYKQERKILQDHATEYQQLMTLLEQLEADRDELRAVKAEYIAQRERLLTLQEELDDELATREDGDEIQQQIDALTQVWETKGLPVFQHYFRELSEAINLLPEEIIAGGNMSLKNGRFVVSITDTELTDFFRAYNPEDFENFSFSFADDNFTAYGATEDTSISLTGMYELNEKENIIYFQLIKLVYNGFELPDTTLRALNEQFDLNFYPGLLDMPFKVQAKEVAIQDGTLRISFVLQR